jgi:predicted nucleic acid-binding protein
MNYELLRGKYLLLDTNVLINYQKYPVQMERVHSKFDEFETIPVLDEMVRFEYIRGAESPEEIKVLKIFLMILFKLTTADVDQLQFPVNQETINTATDIANIYSSRLKNLNAPAIDCFLASQMKKYHKNLFLVTSDHKDFPSLLFDRIGIDTVDTGTDIINICFYKFSKEKFDAAIATFQALS